jgi:hypothetical protein
MILTCPSCGTQYVVKDGAIPRAAARSGARPANTAGANSHPQKRCRRNPVAETEPARPSNLSHQPSRSKNPGGIRRAGRAGRRICGGSAAEEGEQVSAYERDEPLAEEPSPSPIPPEADVVGLAEAAPSHRLEWVEEDEDFSPFAPREPEETRSRSGIISRRRRAADRSDRGRTLVPWRRSSGVKG